MHWFIIIIMPFQFSKKPYINNVVSTFFLIFPIPSFHASLNIPGLDLNIPEV